jgi:hypothetical protein
MMRLLFSSWFLRCSIRIGGDEAEAETEIDCFQPGGTGEKLTLEEKLAAFNPII